MRLSVLEDFQKKNDFEQEKSAKTFLLFSRRRLSWFGKHQKIFRQTRRESGSTAGGAEVAADVVCIATLYDHRAGNCGRWKQ